jgi:hypothetical protein
MMKSFMIPGSLTQVWSSMKTQAGATLCLSSGKM